MGVDDELPVIEVVGAPSDLPLETVVTSGGPWKWRHGVMAAIVVALVALTIGIGGGDGDRSDDDTAGAADTMTSTTTTTVTTTAPAGRYLTGEQAPVFAEVGHVSILLGSVDRGWRLFDLATGYVEPVPVLDGVAPEQLLPVRGGVVVVEGEDFARLQMVRLSSRDAVEAKRLDYWPDVSDDMVSSVVDVFGSGSPDRFWVVLQPMRPGRGAEATLVAVSGERLAGPFELPVEPVAGTESGLIYNAGGRVHLIGPGGTRALVPGVAHGASASAVGLVACDETAQCRQSVVDVDTGAQRTGDTLPAFAVSRAGIVMDVSANGDLAVLSEAPPGREDSRTLLPNNTLHVTGPAGTTVVADVEGARAGPAWLPGRGGVVIFTAYGLLQYTDVDGQLVSERAPGLHTRGDTGMFVIHE